MPEDKEELFQQGATANPTYLIADVGTAELPSPKELKTNTGDDSVACGNADTYYGNNHNGHVDETNAANPTDRADDPTHGVYPTGMEEEPVTRNVEDRVASDGDSANGSVSSTFRVDSVQTKKGHNSRTVSGTCADLASLFRMSTGARSGISGLPDEAERVVDLSDAIRTSDVALFHVQLDGVCIVRSVAGIDEVFSAVLRQVSERELSGGHASFGPLNTQGVWRSLMGDVETVLEQLTTAEKEAAKTCAKLRCQEEHAVSEERWEEAAELSRACTEAKLSASAISFKRQHTILELAERFAALFPDGIAQLRECLTTYLRQLAFICNAIGSISFSKDDRDDINKRKDQYAVQLASINLQLQALEDSFNVEKCAKAEPIKQHHNVVGEDGECATASEQYALSESGGAVEQSGIATADISVSHESGLEGLLESVREEKRIFVEERDILFTEITRMKAELITRENELKVACRHIDQADENIREIESRLATAHEEKRVRESHRQNLLSEKEVVEHNLFTLDHLDLANDQLVRERLKKVAEMLESEAMNVSLAASISIDDILRSNDRRPQDVTEPQDLDDKSGERKHDAGESEQEAGEREQETRGEGDPALSETLASLLRRLKEGISKHENLFGALLTEQGMTRRFLLNGENGSGDGTEVLGVGSEGWRSLYGGLGWVQGLQEDVVLRRAVHCREALLKLFNRKAELEVKVQRAANDLEALDQTKQEAASARNYGLAASKAQEAKTLKTHLNELKVHEKQLSQELAQASAASDLYEQVSTLTFVSEICLDMYRLIQSAGTYLRTHDRTLVEQLRTHTHELGAAEVKFLQLAISKLQPTYCPTKDPDCPNNEES
ncbi:hypothetical protein GNI_136360 [Gregarina niphandrodes]|uniref:Uncharacterized protein n=1 Tax=Gregarina niphandrodes TaxID=110365 RepID=A0A023B0S9_GRENI|nr:hypothetical protein GNI_136360 [Gregarina niphandrodes]EZG45896.1 hypothetical protein GNI_136360 [Gregarina niphandrodes]|eukprot:XP_011132422.1 hypothetical protein GNI_136360 [Gregarina niphandrodes]